MNYCVQCIIPDTRPSIVFDEAGVCSACRAHAGKNAIDWAERADRFRSVAAHARERSTGYDCLIPVSGGKDSTWQVVTCLEHGLRPLTYTWRAPGRTELGQRNLDNLTSLGVDHIDYRIDPRVDRALTRAAFERFGATGVPMHLAMFNIALKLAVRFEIPLIVWGENSAMEYYGDDDARMGFRLDRAWLEKYGVTHGTTAEDWISDELSRKDLTPYYGPDPDSLEAQGVNAVFLGYYFRWDPAMTLAVAQAHGFSPRVEGPKMGYYDYADIDDDFMSVHHCLKWYKFGFTRLFDNLSIEIRNGRMTRDEAVERVRSMGDQTPHEDIAKLCDYLQISIARFWETAERFRNPAIWKRVDRRWTLPGFLVEDWPWTS